VVMGNCGFTLAPCAKADRNLVIRNLQRAEDISAEAMEAGIEWTWTTYAQFLDALEALPKGINYSGYMGHSALRTYVMGERAFDQVATEDDLKAMEKELRSALTAGAMGFTTSRSTSHETPDRRPVASRVAAWDEVRRLVGAMGEMNAGIFEIAGESVDRELGHPGLADYQRRLRELAVETGRPVTFGLFSRKDAPDIWRTYAKLLDETAAAGGRMFAQVHSRWLSAILSFKTQLPFDRLPVWKDLRALPLAEQKQRLRDSRATPPPHRGRARARQSQGGGHGSTAAHLRMDLRHGHRGGTAPLGGGDRQAARGGSRGGHDRRGPRERPRSPLPPAHRQREPGPRA
jgi:N-acyl-D-aspartate/D-glutamate deacylase